MKCRPTARQAGVRTLLQSVRVVLWVVGFGGVRARPLRPRHWSAGVAALLLCITTTLPGKTFTVTKTSDSGSGTLRAAIGSANTNADVDTIVFNLSGGSGVKTITLTSPLPRITNSVIIDARHNPATPASRP